MNCTKEHLTIRKLLCPVKRSESRTESLKKSLSYSGATDVVESESKTEEGHERGKYYYHSICNAR